LNWNSFDTGPNADLVGILTQSVRNAGLKMGLYHSLFEWFNPYFLEDEGNNFTTSTYVDEVLIPQLYDIVNSYQPEIVWTDGDWVANYTYWRSMEFLAWLYNDSPVKDTVCVNDRWGIGTNCEHGGYYTCTDRYNPGKLQNHKWENAMTIDGSSWGYSRNTNISGYLSIDEILDQLVSTVSCGGNVLLNVGPAADGTIHPIFQERLLQVGSWLAVNGESIYSSIPWRAQNDSAANTWYTANSDTGNIYAIFLEWPSNDTLILTEPVPLSNAQIQLVGQNENLQWNYDENILTIQLPSLAVSQLPCQWAWTLRMKGIK